MNFFKFRNRRASPSDERQDEPWKEPTRTVSGTRRQWRFVVVVLTVSVMGVYGLGSLKGMVLVGRSVNSAEHDSPFIAIVQTATRPPTQTPDAAARAQMNATETIVSAIAAAESAAIATQKAIDLELSKVIATATAHSLGVESLAHEESVQMEITAQSLKNAEAAKRGEALTSFLIAILILISCAGLGYAVAAVGGGGRLALTFFSRLKLPKRKEKKRKPTQAKLTNHQHRQRPVRERSPEPTEPESTSEPEPTPEPEPTAPPVIEFAYTDDGGVAHRATIRLNRDVREKLVAVARHVLDGGRFSRRGLRQVLSEAQFKDLTEIFQNANFITVRRGRSAEFTAAGTAFLQSVVGGD